MAMGLHSYHDGAFAWLPLIAIGLCLMSNAAAVSSVSTYIGVFVQQLLDLPSLNTSGEHDPFVLR